ncbi:MAG: hypothetical protein AAFO07_19620 [Bacteroidota bacterium]
MDSTSTTQPLWSTVDKVGFRFFFIFFGLFVFPFPISVLPWISSFTYQGMNVFWSWVVDFVGKNILGIQDQMSSAMTGSGDKLYNWVMYFSILLLAAIGTLFWSLIDQKRANYQKLKWWFLVFLTYYLAHYMFVYGIIKIFYLQFSAPNLATLYQNIGQVSPMRLLWTFMGSSGPYTMFSGWCETIAGLLLIVRRTRTLGGLAAFGVMLNVFMLNMSYDVPVKLFSFQLMSMGLFIALQDYKRIINFFFLNKTAEAVNYSPTFLARNTRMITNIVLGCLAAYLIIAQAISSNNSRKQYGTLREKSPLYGVYQVDNFVINNDTLPPLLTDTVRWKRLILDYPNRLTICQMDEKANWKSCNLDTTLQQLKIKIDSDTTLFHYEKMDESLKLSGIHNGDTLKIDLTAYDLDNFGLLNRGFNWVNEVPYNRYNYNGK